MATALGNCKERITEGGYGEKASKSSSERSVKFSATSNTSSKNTAVAHFTRVHLFLSAHPKWFERLEMFGHHETLRFSNDTHQVRLFGRSRASRPRRRGNGTNRSCRSICGAVGFGSVRTTSGLREPSRLRRLNARTDRIHLRVGYTSASSGLRRKAFHHHGNRRFPNKAETLALPSL